MEQYSLIHSILGCCKIYKVSQWNGPELIFLRYELQYYDEVDNRVGEDLNALIESSKLTFHQKTDALNALNIRRSAMR